MSVPEFEIDTDTPLGALLDSVIRQAAVLDLSDFYVGAEANFDQNVVSVYFSKDAKEESLEALRSAITEKKIDSALEKTGDDHTPWKLVIRAPVEDVTKPTPTTGEVPVAVSLSGDVEMILNQGDMSHAAQNRVPEV